MGENAQTPSAEAIETVFGGCRNTDANNAFKVSLEFAGETFLQKER